MDDFILDDFILDDFILDDFILDDFILDDFYLFIIKIIIELQILFLLSDKKQCVISINLIYFLVKKLTNL